MQRLAFGEGLGGPGGAVDEPAGRGNRGPRDTRQCGHLLGQLGPDGLDGGGRLRGAGDPRDQRGEDRKVVARLRRAGDGATKLLETELLVDERAVLLENGEPRQHDLRRGRRRERVGAHFDQRNLRELLGGESGRVQIVAEGDHQLHRTVVDRIGELGELERRIRLDETGDERTADVRVAVSGNQEPVALPHPADDAGGHRAEGETELAGEPLLLDGLPAGADDGGVGTLRLEQLHGGSERLVHRDGLTVDERLFEAILGGDLLVEQAAGVGHPGVVDLVVAARGDAVDHALA